MDMKPSHIRRAAAADFTVICHTGGQERRAKMVAESVRVGKERLREIFTIRMNVQQQQRRSCSLSVRELGPKRR